MNDKNWNPGTFLPDTISGKEFIKTFLRFKYAEPIKMVIITLPSGRFWGLASHPPFHICTDGSTALINKANAGSMLPASTVSHMVLPSHRGSVSRGCV